MHPKTEATAGCRWVLVPFAALAGFAVAIPLAIPLNFIIHSILWGSGHHMPGKDFIAFALPFDGALAAALVILCGAFTAPAHRARVAMVLLFLGGALAWHLIGIFPPPERDPTGQRLLWWPIAGTCLGGITAFGFVCYAEYHSIVARFVA